MQSEAGKGHPKGLHMYEVERTRRTRRGRRSMAASGCSCVCVQASSSSAEHVRRERGGEGRTVARAREEVVQVGELLGRERLLVRLPAVLVRPLEVGERRLDRSRERRRRGGVLRHALDEDGRDEGRHLVGERLDERRDAEDGRICAEGDEYGVSEKLKVGVPASDKLRVDARAATSASWYPATSLPSASLLLGILVARSVSMKRLMSDTMALR